MSWTYLDLRYFADLVVVLVGMIIPIFVWWSPKERCYGNQLNLGDVPYADIAKNDLYSLLRRSTTDWPIINLLPKDSMAIIRRHIVQFGELPSNNLRVYA